MQRREDRTVGRAGASLIATARNDARLRELADAVPTDERLAVDKLADLVLAAAEKDEADPRRGVLLSACRHRAQLLSARAGTRARAASVERDMYGLGVALQLGDPLTSALYQLQYG